MKKTLALILGLLMIAAAFASCANPGKKEQTGNEPTGIEQNDEYVDDYKFVDDLSDVPVVVEHVMLQPQEIPSNFSLVGTKHLPPIDNQGGIGSCASEAITYMQFTNAVSRYLHSKNDKVRWDPSSGNEKYIFAPKFTFLYSGAGTAWVYDILKDHGCQFVKDCQFYGHTGYKYGVSKNPSSRKAQSVEWQFGEKDLLGALNYRIKDYEQIWMNTLDYSLTTTEKGKDLLYKIKDAVVQGNVVVTGGFSSDWQYAQISEEDAAKSTLAKPGDWVCYWCNGRGGGHQVSVVGYDDDFEYTYEGVTMKGAFQVANSWGDYWKNDGYFWVTYDSVNQISEFAEMNAMKGREPSMDQFCFIYWDKDVVVEMPTAYVTVELSVTDREAFYIELTRTDSTDNCVTHIPALFDYGGNFKQIHSGTQYVDMNLGEMYLTFSGEPNGQAEKGYITLGYNALEVEGKTFDDYLWGVNVYATGATVTLHKISLFDREGNLRSEVVPSDEYKKIKPDQKAGFVFDFGKELAKYHEVGSYKLKNTNSNLYLKLNILPLVTCETVVDAVTFNVGFDLFNRVHEILLDGSDYVLDIKGKAIKDGAEVKFNARNLKRDTQTWRVDRLDDGTYTIRLACDTRYAVGMKDGVVMLVSGKDIRDYGRWYFENAGNDGMAAVVRYKDGQPTVSGRLPTTLSEDSMTVKAYTVSGELAKTFTVRGEDVIRSFNQKIEGLAAGRYVFTFTDSKGILVTSCYVMDIL